MTVEAAEEFCALQAYLLSTAVLTVFHHVWSTFVYTNTSLGSPASAVLRSLGAVITQINPVDSKIYMCLPLGQSFPYPMELPSGLSVRPSFCICFIKILRLVRNERVHLAH